MPLTPHGQRMLRRMRSEYGRKRGDRVFYATANAHQDRIGGKKIHARAPARRRPQRTRRSR